MPCISPQSDAPPAPEPLMDANNPARPKPSVTDTPLSQPCQRTVALFESLSREDLPGLSQFYAPDVHFRDPFNDVNGLPAVRYIFEDMFEKLGQPRFKILNVVESQVPVHQAFLTWDFDYELGRRHGHAHGGSLLLFDENGLIRSHHDYWDAASGLYEHLPVLGVFMRWLRSRVAA